MGHQSDITTSREIDGDLLSITNAGIDLLFPELLRGKAIDALSHP
jgi:hypothetical protein